MKKTLLIIIIFLIILSNIKTEAKGEIPPGLYYIEFSNLTLDNMHNVIDEEILAIEPYINPVYKDCILMKYETLEKTKNKYVTYLEDKGRIQEANKYKSESIKIKRVLIYSKENLKDKYMNYEPVKEYYCKTS